jgi:hypothetical protein
MDTSRWHSGDEVVLRYVTRFDNVPGVSWPARVVEDRDDLLALYIPRGTTYMNWSREPGQPRRLVESYWRRDMLRLMFPGEAHSVWCFWEGDDRHFMAYYVNFEEPYRRTPIGVDTNDHTLDIMVAPDFSWRWKDREDFDRLVANGAFSAEFGETVYAEAERVIAQITDRSAPFDHPWHEWTPPADWAEPCLHPRWREEPTRIWEKRDWAYGPVPPRR